MKPRNLLLITIAFSLLVLGLVSSIQPVAADSITVSVDQPVHALGEPVAITVSYMGGVHGDVMLSVEDSSGAVMNQWKWSHSASDPFQQSVSYTPMNPGSYTIKALHQPHHMEPPVSSSAQVEFWSAQILGLEYASKVDSGKPVDIKATVSYYFTQPTQVKLELRSDTENKNLGSLTQALNGQGTTTLTLTKIVFTSARSQDVTAQISYELPKGSWNSDLTGGAYSAKVIVVPEFALTPAIILLLSLLGAGLVRKRK